jgi:hypothetical protein
MNEMSSGDGLPGRLLGPDDPAPVVLSNPAGASSFLLAGDHAGLACPAALGDLGIAPADWARHIASDLGSRQLGEVLAERLDARFIHQRYSRLVIDCNRDPVHPEAIAASSDGTPIQGNRNLGERERGLRVAEIHAPYHHAIAADLARADRGGPPILVALHSFTPVWQGRGAQACSTVAAPTDSRAPFWRSSRASLALQSVITSLIASTQPTTQCRAMRSDPACLTSNSRSGRTSLPIARELPRGPIAWRGCWWPLRPKSDPRAVSLKGRASPAIGPTGGAVGRYGNKAIFTVP